MILVYYWLELLTHLMWLKGLLSLLSFFLLDTTLVTCFIKWATNINYLPSWLCSLPLSQFSGMAQNFGEKWCQPHYPWLRKPCQWTTHRALPEAHLPHLSSKSDEGKPRGVLSLPTVPSKSCQIVCMRGTHSPHSMNRAHCREVQWQTPHWKALTPPPRCQQGRAWSTAQIRN